MTSPYIETNKGRGIRTLDEVLAGRCDECLGQRTVRKHMFDGSVQHIQCPKCHGTGKREGAS